MSVTIRAYRVPDEDDVVALWEGVVGGELEAESRPHNAYNPPPKTSGLDTGLR